MPNWTYNSVLFVGKEKQLKTLKTMLKSEDNDFDFNNIIPSIQRGTPDQLSGHWVPGSWLNQVAGGKVGQVPRPAA